MISVSSYSVQVVSVNILFNLLTKKLAALEKPHTVNEREMNSMQRLFLRQFLNTVLLVVIVNAKIGLLPDHLEGQFSDFVPAWFYRVGSAITLTLILQAFTPYLMTLLRWLLHQFRLYLYRYVLYVF